MISSIAVVASFTGMPSRQYLVMAISSLSTTSCARSNVMPASSIPGPKITLAPPSSAIIPVRVFSCPAWQSQTFESA